ncbi:hypothetical protein DMENIID0001_091240 [Sergentomyia squamirostris]
MLKIKESCRLCLKKECSIKSIEAYEDEKGRPHELQNLIREAVGIEIQEDDLVKGLCGECAGMVVSVVKFRRKCHRINDCMKKLEESVKMPEVELQQPEQVFILPDPPSFSPRSDSISPLPENHNDQQEMKIPLNQLDKKLAKSNVTTNQKPRKRKINEKRPRSDVNESGLCYICGKHYQYLRVHMASHQPERRKHVCTVCNKTYLYLTNLKFHMQSHQEPRFCCGICGRKLSKKHHLRRHMNIHINVKPYPCAYCDKSFRSHSNRSNHTRTHTGEKPYSCQICYAKFATNTGLHQHHRHNHKPITS